jgi:uncharacterized protein (DUF433 family)
MPPYRPIIERFTEKYKVNKKTGCWDWHGSTVRGGYGLLGSGPPAEPGGKRGMVFAHRFAYQHFVGSIPDGLVVCHRCDNPACVNPEHLFVSSQPGNMKDMERKGRARVLTAEQVKEAIALLGRDHSQSKVATLFDVNRATLQRALKHAASGDYGPKLATTVTSKYTRVTPEQRKQILQLLAQGMPVIQVAAKFGIDRKHVRNIRNRGS